MSAALRIFYATNRTSPLELKPQPVGSPNGEEFNTRWGLSYAYKTKWAALQPVMAWEYDRAMVISFSESGARSELKRRVGDQRIPEDRVRRPSRPEFKRPADIGFSIERELQHEYETKAAQSCSTFFGRKRVYDQTATLGGTRRFWARGLTLQWSKAVRYFSLHREVAVRTTWPITSTALRCLFRNCHCVAGLKLATEWAVFWTELFYNEFCLVLHMQFPNLPEHPFCRTDQAF